MIVYCWYELLLELHAQSPDQSHSHLSGGYRLYNSYTCLDSAKRWKRQSVYRLHNCHWSTDQQIVSGFIQLTILINDFINYCKLYAKDHYQDKIIRFTILPITDLLLTLIYSSTYMRSNTNFWPLLKLNKLKTKCKALALLKDCQVGCSADIIM